LHFIARLLLVFAPGTFEQKRAANEQNNAVNEQKKEQHMSNFEQRMSMNKPP